MSILVDLNPEHVLKYSFELSNFASSSRMPLLFFSFYTDTLDARSTV